MSYLEQSVFCQLEEYQRTEENRFAASELIVDELYMFLSILKSKDPQRQAAKSPVEVKKVETLDMGLYQVKFNFLNQDLKPVARAMGEFDDGYWADPKDQITIGKICIKTGYFRGYGDSLDDELLRLTTEVPTLV